MTILRIAAIALAAGLAGWTVPATADDSEQNAPYRYGPGMMGPGYGPGYYGPPPGMGPGMMGGPGHGYGRGGHMGPGYGYGRHMGPGYGRGTAPGQTGQPPQRGYYGPGMHRGYGPRWDNGQ